MTIRELFLLLMQKGIELKIEVNEEKISVTAKKRHGLREFNETIETTADHIALKKAEASEFIINELVSRINKSIYDYNQRQTQNNTLK